MGGGGGLALGFRCSRITRYMAGSKAPRSLGAPVIGSPWTFLSGEGDGTGGGGGIQIQQFILYFLMG
jgi:hypothetical protein